MDLVGTCPMRRWRKWLAYGGFTPESGKAYVWYTRSSLVTQMSPGDRFYVVAFGRLRGYAPVVKVLTLNGGWFGVMWMRNPGNAVACTIDRSCIGFQGLARRWWPREDEKPFPEWRSLGCDADGHGRARTNGGSYGSRGDVSKGLLGAVDCGG